MWTDWNWINVFFVFFSAWVAYDCFKRDKIKWGWLNLMASALNAALVAVRLI